MAEIDVLILKELQYIVDILRDIRFGLSEYMDEDLSSYHEGESKLPKSERDP